MKEELGSSGNGAGSASNVGSLHGKSGTASSINLTGKSNTAIVLSTSMLQKSQLNAL